LTRRELLTAVGSTFVVRGSSFARRTQNDERRTIRVGIARASGYRIETMLLEQYVSSVLAGEALRGSAPAALEALAIAIRTFAIANLGRHRSDSFDLCDQTHCQVLRTATAGTDRAAQTTAGRMLLAGSIPASIFFSASCGGHTEKPSNVWPGADDPPYLPARPDQACQGAPAWAADIRDADLLRALRAVGYRGNRLENVRIASHTSSGRVGRLRTDGLQPDEISGQDLRVAIGRTLGWQFVKSTAFDLQRTGDGYRFTGRGSGHGVGLCVIGSARLAEQGKSAEDILRQYFPGLTIARGASERSTAAASAPATSIYVPRGDEGEQAALGRAADRAREEIGRALGVAAPRVSLRFHPTTAEYERATGVPWFTSAAVVNGEVHLLPLQVLRDRGVLERTVRRGIAHVMVDPVLKSRPAWVREGAAIYFTEAKSDIRPDPKASCPSDKELLKPVSAGALSNAYARARACFAKQIDAGRAWRDVH
jgi:stage II sporulation protein D (peptidoglycan lytic transglycosylase)